MSESTDATYLDVQLLVATERDVPALQALVQGAYRGESASRGWTHEADLLEGQRIDVDALSAIIADQDNRILLAVVAGTVIGCVQISRISPGLGYLGLLAVDPARQAGGLGRVLIGAAERMAQDQFGATRIEMTVIHTRTELIAYYERGGYRLTEERRPFPYDDLRFGLPRVADLEFVVLVKTLG